MHDIAIYPKVYICSVKIDTLILLNSFLFASLCFFICYHYYQVDMHRISQKPTTIATKGKYPSENLEACK